MVHLRQYKPHRNCAPILPHYNTVIMYVDGIYIAGVYRGVWKRFRRVHWFNAGEPEGASHTIDLQLVSTINFNSS